MRDEMASHSRFRDVTEKPEELVDGQTKSAASLGVANAEFGGHAQRLIVGR